MKRSNKTCVLLMKLYFLFIRYGEKVVIFKKSRNNGLSDIRNRTRTTNNIIRLLLFSQVIFECCHSKNKQIHTRTYTKTVNTESSQYAQNCRPRFNWTICLSVTLIIKWLNLSRLYVSCTNSLYTEPMDTSHALIHWWKPKMKAELR